MLLYLWKVLLMFSHSNWRLRLQIAVLVVFEHLIHQLGEIVDPAEPRCELLCRTTATTLAIFLILS